jgi:hypothetical protein
MKRVAGVLGVGGDGVVRECDGGGDEVLKSLGGDVSSPTTFWWGGVRLMCILQLMTECNLMNHSTGSCTEHQMSLPPPPPSLLPLLCSLSS